MKPLVLASASPRRQELLRNAGIEFEVRAADIPETPRRGEFPENFARRMASEKARAIQRLVPDRTILAADTVVAIARIIHGKPENLILGKPLDTEDAIRMLRLLSGECHGVITAVCLLNQDFEDVRQESTAVHFSQMTEDEIRSYVATGEPMDKAGAYAIQGLASRWVDHILGDYYNVIGLPVDLVWRMLREHGLD